jgi:hypothetical protein
VEGEVKTVRARIALAIDEHGVKIRCSDEHFHAKYEPAEIEENYRRPWDPRYRMQFYEAHVGERSERPKAREGVLKRGLRRLLSLRASLIERHGLRWELQRRFAERGAATASRGRPAGQ